MDLFSIYLKIFLSNRQQHVLADGNFSQFKTVVSSVPQGSVLGLLFFIFYAVDMWNDLENKIISYADESTLYSEVSFSTDCINVFDSLKRDSAKIC